MADGTDGPPLHTRLLQKLNGNVPTYWPGRSIFKVPNHLRRISKQAYEPQVISIGPYHHGKGQLKKMEAYKMFYLKKLLGRRTEISLEDYVTALKEREEEARKFYSEPLNHISGEKFVEIMLFDGCFIIELIRKSAMGELGDENDHFLADFILRGITRDLLLVENQLPFSILLHLFSMTVTPNDEETAFMDIAKDFMEMAIKFFSKIMPGSPRSFENQDIKHLLGSSPRRPEDLKIEHLLGLLHDSCCQASSSDCPQVRLRCSPEKVIRLRCCKVKFEISIEERDEKYWRFIRSATQLSEAGINFEKTMGRLFDIKFQNGVLSIPALAIEDDTEFLLRNLVAYEQYFRDASSKCFTNYIAFMDCLINTWKDVELLCNHGVIDNWLGDHEVVAAMFNKLGDYVLIYEGDFSDYAETFKKVNEHCDRKWNHWKAKLWHNYFNTPWGGISIFAAVSLLLLTLLQSVFSVLSYLFK